MQIDEHRTVDGLLNALDLGKYAIIFKAEEVSAVYGEIYLYKVQFMEKFIYTPYS